ncbi:MAG: LolA family protein [Candidatus Pelagibacter sp.]|tara:strand:- start:239 stop:793 length:555 start_codon:yes stop_codon:yes gene_type:complete
MRIFLFLFFFLFNNFANASIVSQIIKNFDSTKSMKFNFVQTIAGKIEKGECILVYPKKIFCKYNDFYNKILVSNGKSLVINSDKNNQYFRYPLNKTPLYLILDKKFIISKMYQLKKDLDYPFYYVFNLDYESNSIKVFFNKNDLNLIGWETKDIYQNIVQTFISDIKKNIQVNNKIFNIQNYIN